MKPSTRIPLLQAVQNEVIKVGKVVPHDALLVPSVTAFSEGLPFSKGMLYHGDTFEDKLRDATGLHVVGSGVIVLSRNAEARLCLPSDLAAGAMDIAQKPILDHASGLSPEARLALAQRILEM